MRTDLDTAVLEIRKRAAKLAGRQDRRTAAILASASAVLFVLLVVTAAFFAGTMSASGAGGFAYGTMIAGKETGGYILAGVIAFTAGVVATAVCIRHRKK